MFENDINRRLATAIFNFFDYYPLYYYILASIPKVASKNAAIVPTMGVGFTKKDDVDSLALFYNPDWVSKLSSDELQVVIQHEVLHVGLKHLLRWGERNKDLANIAMDVVVNYHINGLKEKVSKELYDNLCVAEKFPTLNGVNLRESTYEDVYELLKKDPNIKWVKVSHNWGNGKGKGKSEAASSQLQRGIIDSALKDAIKKLGNKYPGNIPAELQRHIDELTKTRTDWRKYISIFAQRIAQEDKRTTWKKLNKRLKYAAPGHKSEYRPSLLVVVDNSGSTIPIYDAFISHVATISKYIDVDVIGIDTRVNFEYTFKGGKVPPKFKDSMSGGGTLFQPAFDYAKNKKKYNGIIYLTDGCNFDEGCLNTYKIPVLFAISPDGKEVEGYRNIKIDDPTSARKN